MDLYSQTDAYTVEQTPLMHGSLFIQLLGVCTTLAYIYTLFFLDSSVVLHQDRNVTEGTSFSDQQIHRRIDRRKCLCCLNKVGRYTLVKVYYVIFMMSSNEAQ